MPQARRKTPFSGKAKKQQIQNKKQNRVFLMPTSTTSGETSVNVESMNYQPTAQGRSNRYALKFYRESDQELIIKKEDSLRELNPVPEKELEVNPSEHFPPDLAFPVRPPWDFSMTPAQLDAQEQRYFKNYIDSIQSSPHWRDISYFELNLETWRQLWRVMEMCDILLLIVDVRYAGMMFPPSLYNYIVKEQRKDMILVLNKIDLVPAAAVAAWKEHFTQQYPGLRVIYFTSCPQYNLRGATSDKAGLQVRRRKGRQRMCVEGCTQLLEACRDIVQGAVDLTPWENNIQEEINSTTSEDLQIEETITEKPDTSFYRHERYRNGVLTIGCCGQPNVGKSSLMNAVLGVKRLSVSQTPGHTKHFQTIYKTPEVRFCDCPGLVFPSKVPRPIQILMGSYPIAQLREPYTTIRYMAERLDLPRLLRLEHPEKDDSWSPRDICDAWAKRRGYLTAKAARLDTYRAANSLLRMALEGKICLWLRPPGYTEQKDKFENCSEIKYISWVQALTTDSALEALPEGSSHEEDEEEEDSEEEEEETRVVANKFAALLTED